MNLAANQEPTPVVAHTTVALQLIALRVRSGRLELLHQPRADDGALPTVIPREQDEISETAAQRAEELVGCAGQSLQLEVRGRPADGLTAAYVHLVRPGHPRQPAPTPASGWSWRDHRRIPLNPADREIVDRAIAFVAAQLDAGDVSFALVGEEFTVSELRSVHEAMLQISLDPSNFRKRVCRLVKDGAVEELSRRRPTATRPARLYRRRS